MPGFDLIDKRRFVQDKMQFDPKWKRKMVEAGCKTSRKQTLNQLR